MGSRRFSTNTIVCVSKILSGWLSGKESACQCRRHGFDPWTGKIPLEKEMTIHSSMLAWEIPWIEEPGEPTVHGVTKESDTTDRLKSNKNNA